MKVPINQIKITNRVRKEIAKIEELAADIEVNGLLNPITVMRLTDGDFQLLAGLRRLRAVESIGLAEIDVNVVSPADAEAALRIEISENEQREPFTFSEKMDFARMIEEIEKEKAKERMSLGGKGGMEQEGVDCSPPLEKKKSRDAVGEIIGMSGRQYSRAKHIAENAPEEIIEELDTGQRTIRSAYDELRSLEKAVKSSENDVEDDIFDDDEVESEIEYAVTSQQQPRHTAGLLSKSDEEAVKKIKEYNALSSQDKINELQRQLREERARAAHAESELARLKELRQNDVYHKDGIISNLTARLEEAEARLEELEKTARESG